jgi:hypothetical protein
MQLVGNPLPISYKNKERHDATAFFAVLYVVLIRDPVIEELTVPAAASGESTQSRWRPGVVASEWRLRQRWPVAASRRPGGEASRSEVVEDRLQGLRRRRAQATNSLALARYGILSKLL